METTNLSKTHYPNLKQSIFLILRLMLISILVVIPFTIIMKILEKDSEPQFPLINSLFYLLDYVIPFAIICRFAIRRMRHLNSPEFKLKLISLSPLVMVLMLIMTIALIVIIEPFSYFIPMPDFIKEIMMDLIRPDIFSFLTIVIAAPILEEMFFRGIILEGLLKNYSPIKAIIWSAIIFGLVHLNPWQTIGATIVGFFIGWIYWKTRSILPGILIHFINNLISYMIMYSTDFKTESLMDIIGNQLVYIILFIAASIIFFIGYKSLKKMLEPLTALERSYNK